MSYSNLLLPHPVIRPGGFDYGEEYRFDIRIDKAIRIQDKINLKLSYELHSDFISNMIKEGKAKALAMIKCIKTNQRVIFDFTETHMQSKLQLADYAGKMSIVPYVVTSEKISGFRSKEYDDEIKGLRPNGMDLPTGAILAIGKQHEITIDSIERIQAAINITPNGNIKEGEYLVDTHEDIIQILMHPNTLERIRKLRSRDAIPILYASLYVPAVEHAIRALNDNDKKKSWVQALYKTLEKHSIDPNDELKEHANKYAQEILEDPTSNRKPLDSMISWNEELRLGEDDESE